jgi:uncharacterized membrane protein
MKPWYLSKTLWFNIITLIVGVLAAVLGVVKSQGWVVGLTIFVALGNGILRIWFTDSAIQNPLPQKQP